MDLNIGGEAKCSKRTPRGVLFCNYLQLEGANWKNPIDRGSEKILSGGKDLWLSGRKTCKGAWEQRR